MKEYFLVLDDSYVRVYNRAGEYVTYGSSVQAITEELKAEPHNATVIMMFGPNQNTNALFFWLLEAKQISIADLPIITIFKESSADAN